LGEPSTPSPPQTILYTDVNTSFAMTTQIKPTSRANFDVGVLFYNRARQTLDCVLSFLQEEIQPNIVILDQGSATEQRTFLHEGLSGHANVRFVGSPKNIGVAAGRNRLCEACPPNGFCSSTTIWRSIPVGASASSVPLSKPPTASMLFLPES
jgi:hypothetical protein